MIKWHWLVLAFFLGFVLCYNIDKRTLHYRISMYGYTEEGGERIPVIRLRRAYGHERFNNKDSGLDVEVGRYKISTRESLMFKDEDIDRIMRERYCV